jgi:hypothetical protein
MLIHYGTGFQLVRNTSNHVVVIPLFWDFLLVDSIFEVRMVKGKYSNPDQ